MYNILLPYNEYLTYIHTDNINNFIHKYNIDIQEVKNEKNKLLTNYLDKNMNINLTKGFENLLDYILKYNLNYCIVSNSSNESINIYKIYS